VCQELHEAPYMYKFIKLYMCYLILSLLTTDSITWRVHLLYDEIVLSALELELAHLNFTMAWAEGVAQGLKWWIARLASLRLWVQTPVQKEKNKLTVAQMGRYYSTPFYKWRNSGIVRLSTCYTATMLVSGEYSAGSESM
jgi:hypothetical protein